VSIQTWEGLLQTSGAQTSICGVLILGDRSRAPCCRVGAGCASVLLMLESWVEAHHG
jgi:hypothetical protein